MCIERHHRLTHEACLGNPSCVLLQVVSTYLSTELIELEEHSGVSCASPEAECPVRHRVLKVHEFLPY